MGQKAKTTIHLVTVFSYHDINNCCYMFHYCCFLNFGDRFFKQRYISNELAFVILNLNDLLGGSTRVVLLLFFGSGGNNPQALLKYAISIQDNLENSGI